MTRVLVTGGSGRLGKFVLDELRDHYDLTILDLNPVSDPSFAFEQVDLLDLHTLQEVIKGHDAIVHLAGIDADSPAGMDVLFSVNALGTWNLFYAAEQANISKFVLCSSEAALGGEVLWGDPPLSYLPADEHHPLVPTTTYALSKLTKEEIGRNFARRAGMSVICLRPSLIVFPGDEAELVDGVEEELAIQDHKSLHGHSRDIPGVEPLASLRGYVLAEDTARCFRLALEADCARNFDEFYLAAADSFEPTPTLEFAAKRFGVLPDIRHRKLYDTNPRASMIDVSKARERLGWAPTGDWPSHLASVDADLAERFRAMMG